MSITTWNRLQPGNQAGNTVLGLQAPLADPLWLLGRQWQLGELTAEDAGTPVAAAVETISYPVDRVVVGDSVRPLDGSIALEALVEPEPHVEPDVRARLVGGRDLVAALRAKGFAGAANAAPAHFAMAAPADAAARALVRAMGTNAIDGELARAAIEADVAAAAHRLDPGADQTALRAELTTWATAYRARTGRAAPSAWNATRGEYEFSVVASLDNTDVWLDANEYRGGRLDWSDLRARVVPRAPDSQPHPLKPPTQVLLPTRLGFVGGPARRFFELEHAAVSFGAIAGAPPDVATSLLVDTALLYGGDWFVAPVQVPSCAMTRIVRIAVTDTFGNVTTLQQRTRSDGWRMFELGTLELADFLVVLPALSTSLDGPTIEEVVLGTDEMANIVWAIERSVSDSLGLRVDRASTPTRMPASDAWSYVPLVPPPANWFPLLRDGDQLVAATLVPEVLDATPLGTLLGGWPHVTFARRDVPGEGLRLVRRYQLATSRAGDRQLWISHESHHGLGGIGSAVAPDRLVPPTTRAT